MQAAPRPQFKNIITHSVFYHACSSLSCCVSIDAGARSDCQVPPYSAAIHRGTQLYSRRTVSHHHTSTLPHLFPLHTATCHPLHPLSCLLVNIYRHVKQDGIEGESFTVHWHWQPQFCPKHCGALQGMLGARRAVLFETQRRDGSMQSMSDSSFLQCA